MNQMAPSVISKGNRFKDFRISPVDSLVGGGAPVDIPAVMPKVVADPRNLKLEVNQESACYQKTGD